MSCRLSITGGIVFAIPRIFLAALDTTGPTAFRWPRRSPHAHSLFPEFIKPVGTLCNKRGYTIGELADEARFLGGGICVVVQFYPHPFQLRNFTFQASPVPHEPHHKHQRS